jgi:hypothetical protein
MFLASCMVIVENPSEKPFTGDFRMTPAARYQSMPACEKNLLSSVETKASTTTFGISSYLTSVRRSRPSSAMKRPSIA